MSTSTSARAASSSVGRHLEQRTAADVGSGAADEATEVPDPARPGRGVASSLVEQVAGGADTGLGQLPPDPHPTPDHLVEGLARPRCGGELDDSGAARSTSAPGGHPGRRARDRARPAAARRARRAVEAAPATSVLDQRTKLTSSASSSSSRSVREVALLALFVEPGVRGPGHGGIEVPAHRRSARASRCVRRRGRTRPAACGLERPPTRSRSIHHSAPEPSITPPSRPSTWPAKLHRLEHPVVVRQLEGVVDPEAPFGSAADRRSRAVVGKGVSSGERSSEPRALRGEQVELDLDGQVAVAQSRRRGRDGPVGRPTGSAGSQAWPMTGRPSRSARSWRCCRGGPVVLVDRAPCASPSASAMRREDLCLVARGRRLMRAARALRDRSCREAAAAWSIERVLEPHLAADGRIGVEEGLAGLRGMVGGATPPECPARDRRRLVRR